MEEKMFEMLTKIYSEMQNMKGELKDEIKDIKDEIKEMKTDIKDLKIETKKNSIELEDVKNKIDILVEVVEESNNAHRRHRKRDMDYIEGRLDLIETAISNINPSIYKSHF